MTTKSGFDLDDILIPPEPEIVTSIQDSFSHGVAFKLAFIGVGQCGGRIAHVFNQLGYARTCAVNTTVADLGRLELPAIQKLDLGNARGAGKDPELAAAIFANKTEDIFDLMQRNWGTDVDYAMVCFAAAGGTGAGGFGKVAEVAKHYMQHNKRQVKVGAIVALPKDDEGQQYARNALRTVKLLQQSGLSPIIIIDNQRVKELYHPTQAAVHLIENGATAKLLHMFNRLAGTESEDTSFDRAEFAKLLDAGVITFAADTLTSWATATDMSTAIRERLQRNTLATVDYKTAKMAGLIYVLSGSARDVNSGHLDHGTAMFTRMLGEGSVVFTGIYNDSPKGLNAVKILAMVGGVAWPTQRILELAMRAGVTLDA